MPITGLSGARTDSVGRADERACRENWRLEGGFSDNAPRITTENSLSGLKDRHGFKMTFEIPVCQTALSISISFLLSLSFSVINNHRLPLVVSSLTCV